jgi:DNA-directed RNA polymerase specialized sigma24 family protein
MDAAVAQTGEFHAFYAAVFGRLVGQLYLVTGDVHEAEDVVQEADAGVGSLVAHRRLTSPRRGCGVWR